MSTSGVGGGQLYNNSSLDADDKALLTQLSQATGSTQSSQDQVLLQALARSNNLLSVEVAEACNSGNYSAATTKKILDDIDATPDLNNAPGLGIIHAMVKEENGAAPAEAVALDNYARHSPVGPYLQNQPPPGPPPAILLGPWEELQQDPYLSLSDENAIEQLYASTGSTKSAQDAPLVTQLSQSKNVLAADIGKALDSGNYGSSVVKTMLTNLDSDPAIHAQPGQEVLSQLAVTSYLMSSPEFEAMNAFSDTMSGNHNDPFWSTSGGPF